MFFQQFFEPNSSTYTYLIADLVDKSAIIIDPVIDIVDDYTKVINKHDLKLVVALDTHVHADHITASGQLRKKTDCKIVMGEKTLADCVDTRVREGENIQIGNLNFKPIYTPGHTDDSYSFLLDNNVFTGDTLLINATGRTDFQNGDSLAAYDSLFNKLLKLPDDCKVYPAHDYNGKKFSTIGQERRHNPRLQVKSAEEYKIMMDNLKLPYPKQIDRAVPANLKCGLAN